MSDSKIQLLEIRRLICDDLWFCPAPSPVFGVSPDLSTAHGPKKNVALFSCKFFFGASIMPNKEVILAWLYSRGSPPEFAFSHKRGRMDFYPLYRKSKSSLLKKFSSFLSSFLCGKCAICCIRRQKAAKKSNNCLTACLAISSPKDQSSSLGPVY